MSIPFKIDYTDYNEDASPVSNDVKIKTSHNKLISQSENSKKAKEWREKNPEKSVKIGKIAGYTSFNLKTGIHNLTHEQMSRHSKKLYKEGKGIAKVTKKERSKIGKLFGKKNLCDEIICEKCGKIINKGNYSKSHGNKCRELDKIKLINLLPNKFTKTIVKQIALKNSINDFEKLNILHDSCEYTKCIKKVDKPNQYNPCWYSKNKKEINKVKRYLNK